jgi:hypothetical protein
MGMLYFRLFFIQQRRQKHHRVAKVEEEVIIALQTTFEVGTKFFLVCIYIHVYHSGFISEGMAETLQMCI